MGAILKQILDDWSTGVVTSAEQDQVPPTSYIHGYNAALTSIGAGKAAVMKRRGMRVLNGTQVSGATAVIGIHDFKEVGGAGFNHHRLLVSDNGRVDVLNNDGTTTAVSTPFTASTSQEHIPSFVDAANLSFIVNGLEAKKYNGTAIQTFGIVAPSTAPTLADSGSAGSHNGTYEARVTFGNSTTLHESSPGTTSATVTVTNKIISWTNIPVSADTQVDRRYLYIRNTATQANFYLVKTISDNVTTSTTTNTADASLTEIGPDLQEHDPPPAGVIDLAWHRSRMFAIDATTLYYSQLEMPEAFDTASGFEAVDPDNSQQLVAIISAFDLLVIFKTNAMYALVGDDPNTWSVRQIDANLGCIAKRSVMFVDGALYFWTEQGPAVWAGTGKPELIAQPFISATISFDNLSADFTATSHICGAPDIQNQRVMWAVPELGQTRNTLILPYNYRLQRWESDGWDPFDVASMAVMEDANGTPWVHIGSYAGQAFRWWDATNDGVATGTVQGTFTAAAGTVTTVTDLTATFDTTGGGLVERKVIIVDSSGNPTDTIRPRIVSNTATSFTLVSAVGGLTTGQTYTYYIGGPAFDFYTPWLVQDDALQKKRYMFLYIQIRPTNTVSNLRIDTFTNYNLNPTSARQQTFSTAADTGQWDVSLWDVALWDAALASTQRFRIGRTGISFLARIRHYVPDSEFTLTKVGVMAESLSERLG